MSIPETADDESGGGRRVWCRPYGSNKIGRLVWVDFRNGYTDKKRRSEGQSDMPESLDKILKSYVNDVHTLYGDQLKL